MKMTKMAVLGHEFQCVNPGALDSCPGINDNHVGSILIDSAFRLIQSDPNNNWGALSIYWLFGVIRSGERQRQFSEDDLIFSKTRTVAKMNCTCSICKHTESKTCIGVRCACCVLMRNKQIIGHFNKLHQ